MIFEVGSTGVRGEWRSEKEFPFLSLIVVVDLVSCKNEPCLSKSCQVRVALSDTISFHCHRKTQMTYSWGHSWGFISDRKSASATSSSLLSLSHISRSCTHTHARTHTHTHTLILHNFNVQVYTNFK